MNNEILTNTEKGHTTRNIKYLLQHRYTFKLYIKFKRDPDYGTSIRARHFYGNEHSCTYKQCLAGKVDKIVLDKIKGYNDLINLVEKGSFKGQYLSAKIFGKEQGSNDFNILHREYIKGKLQKDSVTDPIIDITDQFTLLFYKIEYGRLVIAETPFC